MQQQSLNWRSLPVKRLGNGQDTRQRFIKMKETSAYQRSKQSAEVDCPTALRSAISEGEILNCSITQNATTDGYQVHAHQMSQFHLTQIQWQGAVQLKHESLADQYIMSIVLAGSLSQKIDLHQVCCSSAPTATMVCPGQTLESMASEDGQALLISIDRVAIDLALNRLLDRPAKQPLIFQASIDLSSKLGLSLNRFSQFLWSTAANAEDFSLSVMQKLEQTFLDCVIEGLPNNYSEELLYQNDSAFDCHVRKALAFIESHLHEDIKLGDIAAAASVCSRLLQKAFSHHCGCSPMRFLTQTRLQRIRQELEQADSDTKIVDVMMQYGFTQGGKFAKEYQQLFGEKPSDTLKRRAQPQPSLWQEIDDQLSERVAGGRSAQIGCFPAAASDRLLRGNDTRPSMEYLLKGLNNQLSIPNASNYPLMYSRSAFPH